MKRYNLINKGNVKLSTWGMKAIGGVRVRVGVGVGVGLKNFSWLGPHEGDLYLHNNKKWYSSGGERPKNSLGNILNSLFTNHINKQYLSNEGSQKPIEELVFDQYELLFKNYKGYSRGGINTKYRISC